MSFDKSVERKFEDVERFSLDDLSYIDPDLLLITKTLEGVISRAALPTSYSVLEIEGLLEARGLCLDPPWGKRESCSLDSRIKLVLDKWIESNKIEFDGHNYTFSAKKKAQPIS